jgi:hypothetical protein
MSNAKQHIEKRIWLPDPLPAWALTRTAAGGEGDAAFAAGAALARLDGIVRVQPVWAGCWRSRRALACAAGAVKLLRGREDERALRDAVLLTPPGSDPGPGGRVLIAFERVAGRKPVIATSLVTELAELFGLAPDEKLLAFVDHVEAAMQAGRAAPFAAAAFLETTLSERPDAEPLAYALADMVVAGLLRWPFTLPLLMAERHGPAFRAPGGGGRVRPGDPDFPRAICLALADGAAAALHTAGTVARGADSLLAAAPKVRTKGAGAVIESLLGRDAVSAAAPGSGLSRWASRRLFERLEALGAIRELSGRTSFRIYGL